MWKVSELYLEGVWKDVVRVSSGCLDSVWKVFAMSLSVALLAEFVQIFPPLTTKTLGAHSRGAHI